ncbi:hypothetical protein B7494_g665 [Chlorociboria aeruginascens]|nr:hypothetical protein B7494_g665 [Chlorociboria aeruginascens]
MAKGSDKSYTYMISNNGNFGDYFWASRNEGDGNSKDQNSQSDGSENAWSTAGNADVVNHDADSGAQNEQKVKEVKKGKCSRQKERSRALIQFVSSADAYSDAKIEASLKYVEKLVISNGT